MTQREEKSLFSDPKARKRWEELASQSLKGQDLEKVLNHSTVEGINYKGLYSESRRVVQFYHFPEKVVSSRVYDSGLASSAQMLEDQNQGMQEAVLLIKGSSWKKDFSKNLQARFIVQRASEDFLEEFKGLEKVFVDVNCLNFSKFDSELERVESNNLGYAINLSQIHNAGASAVQELGYALNMFSILLKRGVDPARILFFTANDSLFFLNIAKLRALRYLGEEILSAFQLKPELFILSVSSLREQTLYDPWVNMLRNCASGVAAVLGGANQVAIRTHDSLFSFLTGEKPSEQACRSARNTLNIVREESRFDFVTDAAKGSFALENLTEELIQQSWESFLNWEDKGFLENMGEFSKSVEAIAKARREKVRKRQNVVTGVSDFANPDENIESLYQKPWRPVELRSGLFPLRRTAYEFEELRLALEKSDKEVKACLIHHGEISRLSGRINFMKNIFETLGVEIHEPGSGIDTEQALEDARARNCNVLLFCGLDKDYGDWLRPADKSVFKHQFVAGNKDNFKSLPPEHKEEFMDLYMGKNIYADLKAMLIEEGIL